jgi:hypothetical protein
MFARTPKKAEYYDHDANYFTIMYTMRKLVGEDLLSRRIYVNHTVLAEIKEKGGYYILNEHNVIFAPWTDDKFRKFTDYLVREDHFN